MQTKTRHPRQKPLRRMLQHNIPPRQIPSLQPKKTKQHRPQNLPKNHTKMRHLRIRQNRRHSSHRPKQIQPFPKKPNRPLPKPPQNDPQPHFPPRNLHHPQTKRLRPPARRHHHKILTNKPTKPPFSTKKDALSPLKREITSFCLKFLPKSIKTQKPTKF